MAGEVGTSQTEKIQAREAEMKRSDGRTESNAKGENVNTERGRLKRDSEPGQEAKKQTPLQHNLPMTCFNSPVRYGEVTPLLPPPLPPLSWGISSAWLAPHQR